MKKKHEFSTVHLQHSVVTTIIIKSKENSIQQEASSLLINFSKKTNFRRKIH
jgi:hypothetical protein